MPTSNKGIKIEESGENEAKLKKICWSFKKLYEYTTEKVWWRVQKKGANAQGARGSFSGF